MQLRTRIVLDLYHAPLTAAHQGPGLVKLPI